MGTRLAKRQIASQDYKATLREAVAEGNQQLRVAVPSGAVGEYESLTVCMRRRVQKALDRGLRRVIRDRFDQVGLRRRNRQIEKEYREDGNPASCADLIRYVESQLRLADRRAR